MLIRKLEKAGKNFAVAAMAAVIAATGLTACGKEPEQSADVSPTPEATLTPAATPTPEPTPTEAATPTPEPTPTPTPGPSGSGGKEPGNQGGGKEPEKREETDLNGIFGLEGLTVQYDGYEEAGYFEERELSYIVRAKEGNQLVKIFLVLSNTAGIDQSFDFFSMEIDYQLLCGDKRIKPEITLLSGDLNLPAELPAGERMWGCLVFETGKDADLSNGTLVIQRDNFECRVPLK